MKKSIFFYSLVFLFFIMGNVTTAYSQKIKKLGLASELVYFKTTAEFELSTILMDDTLRQNRPTEVFNVLKKYQVLSTQVDQFITQLTMDIRQQKNNLKLYNRLDKKVKGGKDEKDEKDEKTKKYLTALNIIHQSLDSYIKETTTLKEIKLKDAPLINLFTLDAKSLEAIEYFDNIISIYKVIEGILTARRERTAKAADSLIEQLLSLRLKSPRELLALKTPKKAK
ncbi:MAG: hypothetical protein AB8G15_06865 [Saprospiraceae bacterium]